MKINKNTEIVFDFYVDKILSLVKIKNKNVILIGLGNTKFIKLIKPHVIPSMQYKLIPYSKRVLYKSDELLESCDANQQPSTPLTKCEGSETNS